MQNRTSSYQRIGMDDCLGWKAESCPVYDLVETGFIARGMYGKAIFVIEGQVFIVIYI